MATLDEKLQRLRDEGVLVDDPPEAHRAVIDGLTPDEIEVIIAVKHRLEHADRVAGARPPCDEVPGYVAWIHF